MRLRGNVLIFLFMVGLSGCASSGGGSSSPAAGGGGGGTGTTFTTAAGIDTNVVGSVGVPNAPSFAGGLSAAAHQTATAGGPSFDGSSGVYPASNTSFPILGSVLSFTQGPGVQ